MFSFLKKEVLVTSAMVFFSISAFADSDHSDAGLGLTSEGLKPVRADSHAPIGVMGEHMHKQGEWMLSYRFMHMDMEGNRDGETELSPEQIIANTANRFFGIAGQPANLRIVPTEMTMDMHMFGAMFAPTDWLTLMAMGMYIEKSM
ncbi:MAG: hypothetical protein MI865_01550, partial [Proteobacteria bacterium]|nr:hypothetical protein [Pseudomonadota bacterium]